MRDWSWRRAWAKVKDKRKDKSIDLLTDILDKFSLDKPIVRTVNVPKILLQDFSTDNMQIVPYNKPKTIDELYMDMIMNFLEKIIITDKKLKIKGKNGIKETRTTI